MKAESLSTGAPEKERRIQDLARVLKNRSQFQSAFCLLLGAGASATSGIRTAGELVREWKSDLYLDYGDGKSVEDDDITKYFSENHSSWFDSDNEYASLFERMFNSQRQRRIFVEEEVERGCPSIGYAYLSNLVSSDFFNTILTTNFDDLLNEAFFRFANIRPYVCAHDSSVKDLSLTSKRPKIIKLHGDYLYEDIKCTPENLKRLSVNMAEKMKQFLSEYGLVVSGYSGGDESIIRVLDDLLNDSDKLEGNIYWCLRREDVISDDLAKLIKEKSIHYVYVDGFDELMAELHEICCTKKISFLSADPIQSTSNITKSWIDKNKINKTKCRIISNHIDGLKKSRKARNFADLITNNIIEDGSSVSDKFNIEEYSRLVEIDQVVSANDMAAALNKVDFLLAGNPGFEFKKKLLEIKNYILYETDRYSEAVDVADILIGLDGDNPRNHLLKCKATVNLSSKMEVLDVAISKDEYYFMSHFRKANVMELMLKRGALLKKKENLEIIEKGYRTSILRYPFIGNPAWPSLIEFLLHHRTVDVLKDIERLQDQDRYHPQIAGMLLESCKNKNDPNINEGGENKTIFKFIEECSENYYPKDELDFWPRIVESAIFFSNHKFATSNKSKYENLARNKLDKKVALSMVDFYIEICKDYDAAIAYLEEQVNQESEDALIARLVELYLANNSPEKAQAVYDKYRIQLSSGVSWELRQSIFMGKGNYGKAIDVLMERSGRQYFYEDHAGTLTFMYLKAKQYEKIYEMCNGIFKSGLGEEAANQVRINYEFAKLKLDKKVNKRRLEGILESAKSNDKKDVVAVAHLLLGKKDECLRILVEQVKVRYSRLNDYGDWPVLEGIRSELNASVGHNEKLRSVAS